MKNFSLEEQSKILDGERSNNFLDTNKLETMYPQIQNIKTSVNKFYINIKIHIYLKREPKKEYYYRTRI